MPFSRRQALHAGLLAACGGLLAACGPNQPAPPTAASAAQTTATRAAGGAVIQPNPGPTTPPSLSPVASPSAVAAAAASPSPAAKPAASPVAAPSPSPAAARSAAASAALPARQMYQQDAQHTGRGTFAGPRQPPRVLRTYDTSTPDNLPADALIPRDDFQSSMVIGADGTLYVANFPGVLFALRDGAAADRLQVVWRFHPPAASSLHATPALNADGSTLYLAFSSGGANRPSAATLYALDTASSGTSPRVAWRLDLGATRTMSSPIVGPDGTIYQGTAGGQLFAVSPSGSVKWTAPTGPTIKSAPALASDGTVYLPSSDGKLYAVSPQGQAKWAFDFGEHLGPTPLVTSTQSGPGGGGGGANGIGTGASPTIGPDGTIYIGANNSNMYAIAPDGSLKWLFEAQRELAGIWTTPALSADGRTIFFGANAGGIYALNAADGSTRWQFPVYGSIYASSTLDKNGLLFTGSTIEHLNAIDSASGEQLWDLDIHNEVWSAPGIRPDGTLVIADRGGLVQVIG